MSDEVAGDAVPAEHPEPGVDGALIFRTTVDGQVFEVRRDWPSGTRYNWINGPNPDYGFWSSGGPHTLPDVQHVKAIRKFLTMIDPETGYIAD